MFIYNFFWGRDWRRLCLVSSVAAVAVVMSMGWAPMSYVPLRYLETRYPRTAPNNDLQRYYGVVVLGGGGEERRVAAFQLIQKYPEIKILFTGNGASTLTPMGSKTEQLVKRALYVPTSSTTYKDAVDSAILVGVDVAQPWLLVTSAWHMPRALATFRNVDWNVTPYLVDFRTESRIPWMQFSLAKGAIRWRIVLHEYVGVLYYLAAGRI